MKTKWDLSQECMGGSNTKINQYNTAYKQNEEETHDHLNQWGKKSI